MFASSLLLGIVSLLTIHIGAAAPIRVDSPAVSMGDGSMQAYAIVDDVTNEPSEYGVEMTEEIMDMMTMPSEASNGEWDILDAEGEVFWPCCGHEAIFLNFDDLGADIPIEHVVVNWNPEGHPPMDLFDVPHFDFHFYLISDAQRTAIENPETVAQACDKYALFIPLTCEDLYLQAQTIPIDQTPANHICPFAGATVEPAMGLHLVDRTDLPPPHFSHTWIYGMQEGQLNFLEPMVSVDYFLSIKDGLLSDDNGGSVETGSNVTRVTKGITLPAAGPKAGWYPTKYSMEFDSNDKKYKVRLFDLTWLPESNGVTPDTPTCPPPPPKPMTGGKGDPHFFLWDGRSFDFMGECDLVLYSVPKFHDELDLNIHVRTTMRYEYSFITSAAVQIGDEIFEAASFGEYFLNGVNLASAGALSMELNGFQVVHEKREEKDDKFAIVIGPTENITVSVHKDMVSVSVLGATVEHFGESIGLTGNFYTGKMLARDGKTVMGDADTFGQEWQVHDDEPSLFQTVRAPQHPKEVCRLPTKAQMEGRRRLGEDVAWQEEAEEACAQVSAKMKKACVYDVIATRDVGAASGYVE